MIALDVEGVVVLQEPAMEVAEGRGQPTLKLQLYSPPHGLMCCLWLS